MRLRERCFTVDAWLGAQYSIMKNKTEAAGFNITHIYE